MERPFSQACDNNKEPILAILKKYCVDTDYVLEVGSGTGQHAAYFSQHLAHLQWQPTDRIDNLAGISSWRDWSGNENLLAPLELDVNKPWPVSTTQAIFSANTLHIMSWLEVETFFNTVKTVLLDKGILAVYGPFNYQGKFTSASNANFDQWLKSRNSLSGIRNFEAVNDLAKNIGLELLEDCTMPANNRLLVWQKSKNIK
jgi:hypothetical protein